VPGHHSVGRQLVPRGKDLEREDRGGDDERLRDRRVLDGVRVRHGAELDEVHADALGPGGQPFAGAGDLEPRVEHAGGLGALTGRE
jgi:hypothetical protein